MAKFFTKKALEDVENRWGREDEVQTLDFQDTEDFFVRMMRKTDWILDDQTWNDLDMNRNYLKMNRTYSMPGQQCLYNMLRILQFDEEELKRRNRIIEFYRMNKEKRQQVQCLLRYLGKDEYDSAAGILYKEIPPLPNVRAWVIPSTIGMIASFFTIPFWGVRGVLMVVLFFLINMLIHHLMNKATEQALPGIRYLSRMLVAAREIKKLDIPELAEYNEFFDKVTDKCAAILRKNRSLGVTGSGDMTGLVVYINIMFLVEARAYLRCMADIRASAPALRTLYRKIGELDALQSVASFKRGLRHVTRPVFTEKKNYLKAEQIGYPMLLNAVCNDITIDGRNMVLTGSNMSGKSTFLRTIGLNAILAQTFDMVMAKSYEASMFSIMTSISPSDDLSEGTSYYMAEAKALLRMLGALSDDISSLLLIDEIFRGTNPTERVAAASSLLKYLSDKNCMIIVATHDIEITQEVADLYDQYHFEEMVTKDKLEFDYLLKPGNLKKPNGIRILEYIGYPPEIIEDALAHVKSQFPEEENNEE